MESLSRVLEMFSNQLQNEELDLYGEEEVKEAAKVTLERISARKRRTKFDVLRGLSSTQTFSAHILPSLSNQSEDPSLYKVGMGSDVAVVRTVAGTDLFNGCQYDILCGILKSQCDE